MKNNKIISTVLTVMLTMFLFVGCGETKNETTDREGNTITLPENVERIISTAPSNTEILVGLGLADEIVAVDQYSVDIEGLSADVTAVDFSNPDIEAIMEMNPDVIVASTLNKSGGDDPFATLVESGVTVIYIPSSASFEEIYKDIEFIAEVTGTEEKGKEIVDEMKSDIAEIQDIAKTIKDEKTVYFEISSSPSLYTTGNDTFINDMIEIVGAKNIFAEESGWLAISEEVVIDKNPDVIITNEDYMENAVSDIETRTGFETITAVKDGAVYLVGNNATARCSQKSIEGLKQIAKAIYPEYYENQ